MRARPLSILLLILALSLSGCRPRPATAEVSLFFTRSDGTAITLAEVRRSVHRGDATQLLQSALGELLKGPTAEEKGRGLTTSIPSGTRLLGVEIRGGVARVNFSREVEQGGGSASMLGRFWQIVYASTQFKEAPRAQILIEGQVQEAMGGEGVIIGQPVLRPSAVPRF